MLSPTSQRTIVLAASLALAACDRGDSPLGPTEDPPASATGAVPTGPVAPENLPALTTGQRIAFISSRDPGLPNLANGNVYKIDPQGNNEVRVTSEPGENDYAPSWSYDNKRIAMVRYRLDGTVGHSDIWVVDANGSNGHWVRHDPSPWDLFDPSWSPDGSHLVLTMWVQPYWYLAKMDLASGNIYLITPLSGGIVGTRPKYDKTGQKIVFVGSKYNTIEQINADGSGRKIRYTSNVYVDRPEFSPDGKRIAFEKYVAGGSDEIFVKNLVTGITKRLTTSSTPDEGPTWSPDGTRIAFSSQRSGKAQIWAMNASTGGSLVRVTHTTSHERYPSWSH